MPQKLIDQTTIQPDGKPGDDAFTAFATCNDNFADAEQRLTALEAVGQDVEHLKTGLQQETQLRADADSALSQAVAAEVSARQNADAAITARIAGKNLLINGDFRFWQRGSNFTVPGYTADRWTFNFGGVASGNVWRNTVSLGQFPGVYADALARVSYGSITDAASHFVVFEQHIEGCDTAAGQTVTVSFWVYNSGAAGRQLAVELRQGFGNGGSAIVDSIGSKKFALPAGMSRVTHSVAIPSVAGKQRGANDALAVTFWCSAGTQWNARSDSLGPQTGDLHFTEVQVEVGSTATGFERRNRALELMLCQRYYEKSYNTDIAPGTANTTEGVTQFQIGGLNSSGRTVSLMVPFRVTKRVKPAFTTYSYATGAAGRVRDAMASTDVAPGNSNMGTSGGSLDVTLSANVLVNVVAHWTADAEI
ncbi:hypothetical protein I5T99_12675 [Stenotrophomonas maltophilia]|nr:hypothetical protein [Stenotrophomonas maltophilia]